MEQKKYDFKPFKGWPPEDYPVNGYKQLVECDSIRIAHGCNGHLNDDFDDAVVGVYEIMMERLGDMFPGWNVETGGDYLAIFLDKEIPDDPRADDNGNVTVVFESGMVGLHFAVKCYESGKVIVDEDNELDLAGLAIKDFLINKYHDPFLEFYWNQDGDHVECRSHTTDAEFSIINTDIYGNPTLRDDKTKEIFPIRML